MNTFKKPTKTTGTAHSSDGETANTSIPVASSNSMPNNDDKNEIDLTLNDSPVPIDDKNLKIIDIFNNTNPLPQHTTIIPSTLNESAHFDPLITTDNGNLQELESLLKSTFQKTSINNDATPLSTQVSTISNDDISDLKSVIVNLSQTLMSKMNTIESKIDDHCSQTKKINHILTNTILPSLLDLSDIIQETASTNLDINTKNKLENIQTRIRTTQQQQQNEMKNLMDI